MRLIFKIIVIFFPAINISISQSFINDTVKVNFRDTLRNVSIQDNDTTSTTDSTGVLSDTSSILRRTRSGLDSIVVYSASEKVSYKINTKIMQMQGNSKLSYKTQKLDAENIEVDFNASTLTSSGGKDTSGKLYGNPKFNDAGEEFIGKVIRYNFKTKKGTIVFGETELTEGFYFAEKIKRVSELEAFGQEGKYTTCDNPHPHFHFGSPEMKLVVKDRIFLDPIIFYVEDMPIFIFPFGLFFPNKTGRQSGIMIPSFFFSGNRGVVLEDFGYYYAASDYWDTKITADYYSKGGYLLKSSTQWKLLNHFDGSANIEFGRTRLDPDSPLETRYSIGLNHSHVLTPQSNLSARLNFMSQDFNRNTYTTYDKIVQQNLTSNASYSERFDNGSSFSISYDRNQNIINGNYTQILPRVSYSLPNLYLLKNLVSSNSWLKDITFRYDGSAERTDSRTKTEEIINDTIKVEKINYSYTAKITHRPSLVISPKLGYFTISPSLSFNANNYFRRITKYFDTKDSTVKDNVERGFFTEYNYSLGLRAQTTVYGMIDDERPFLFLLKPSTFGIKAIRHLYQPSISISYTPDLSSSKFGFYDKYYNEKTGQEVQYSRFDLDGGGIASRSLSYRLGYSDLHRIEIKVPQKDTLPDVNISLVEFNINTDYNFAADSLNLSPVNLSFRSPALTFISFTGSARFTLYDEVRLNDPRTGNPTNNFATINKFLISNNKGLARLTNFSLEFSTSFSSQGVKIFQEITEETETFPKKDSLGLGERFNKRLEYIEKPDDIFADSSPGYSAINIPWNLDVGLRYNYSRPFSNLKSQDLNLRLSFSVNLTQTWTFSTSTQYDYFQKELLIPAFNVRKDLHCWQLSFTWYPSGIYRGFHLLFSAKAPQLRDLKLEQRDNQLYR